MNNQTFRVTPSCVERILCWQGPKLCNSTSTDDDVVTVYIIRNEITMIVWIRDHRKMLVLDTTGKAI
jgi:hypothetical protein